ncbi:MAG: DegT/DnrJ/EryC1/StrS family aminotransferase [Desulfatiglandaceae bacterium]
MKVPLLDLKKQYASIEEEVMQVTEEVFRSQRFILGPKVEELEEAIAGYCGCPYAVGVSSGTDALIISLMTAGVGPGDIVLTTPYTFFATVGAIVRVGARPMFVDIKEDTFNMDPVLLEKAFLSLRDDERKQVKAVIPVHLYGQCADMQPIVKAAQDFGAVVIEDGAQAIGAEYEWDDGKAYRAGAMGQYGCFSFFPSKNLGAFGDGGMVTTTDSEIYERLKVMRVHGGKPKYYHHLIGGNFRLDAFQAAILSVKLKRLDAWTGQRQENAALYRRFFREAGVEGIRLPEEKEKRHIYNQFIVRLKENRDELKAFLNDRDVGCEIYYPVPLHMQTCFSYLGYEKNDFPVSVAAAETSLALPIFPELTPDQIHYVVDMITEYVDEKE